MSNTYITYDESIQIDQEVLEYLRNYGIKKNTTLNSREIEDLCDDIVKDFISDFKVVLIKDILQTIDVKYEFCRMKGSEGSHYPIAEIYNDIKTKYNI